MNTNRFDSSIKIISKKELQLSGYNVIFYKSESAGMLIDVIDEKSGSHNYMEGFLSHWDDSSDIREDLIPMIDSVNNGYSISEFISSEISCAYIEKETAFFIYESDIKKGKEEAFKDPDRYIPTKIFKEIILKWLEFLESKESQA